MSDVPDFAGAARQPVDWEKGALIGTGVLICILLLVIPMISIFVLAFSDGIAAVWKNLSDSDMLHLSLIHI